MRIAAGIVTFNPEIGRLAENIDAIQGQVERVYVYDNGSLNLSEIKACLKEWGQKTFLVSSPVNNGLAIALNTIADSCRSDGFTHVLFLDQDSVASMGMAEALRSIMGGDIGVVAALSIDRNTNLSESIGTSTIDDVGAMTSGSLVNLDAHKDVGGYDERLFIDWVDFEFCDHLRSAGWRVVKTGTTTFLHECGKQELSWLRIPRRRKDGAGWELRQHPRTNHSLERVEDQMRSRVITIKKYGRSPIGFMERRKLVIHSLAMLLVERNKLGIIRACWKGYCRGKSEFL